MDIVVMVIGAACLITVGYLYKKDPERWRQNRQKFLGRMKSEPEETSSTDADTKE